LEKREAETFCEYRDITCENMSKNRRFSLLNTALRSNFGTAYLCLTVTLAGNWRLINAYYVSSTCPEHICFRWKLFFLGVFGTPKWLTPRPTASCIQTL